MENVQNIIVTYVKNHAKGIGLKKLWFLIAERTTKSENQQEVFFRLLDSDHVIEAQALKDHKYNLVSNRR